MRLKLRVLLIGIVLAGAAGCEHCCMMKNESTSTTKQADSPGSPDTAVESSESK
jgi:hypothetical protein